MQVEYMGITYREQHEPKEDPLQVVPNIAKRARPPHLPFELTARFSIFSGAARTLEAPRSKRMVDQEVRILK